MLRNAVHTDGQDYLTWYDPGTPDGQSFYARLEPAAHQIRLTAEDVIADVVTNVHLARRNKDMLDYTEFAARRFDFLGQKAIYVKYIADLYGQSQAQTSDRRAVHHNLGESNGLTRDMLAQDSMLRDLYQKLWLGENRPYYLGNILARYDQETRRWENFSNRISRSQRIYEQHALPPLVGPGELAQ
jgi:hypothetical protein